MFMKKTRRAGVDWQHVGPRVAGAGLLAATGAIHLDLYLTGYRSIPVIGWLFLLQVIAAFGLAAAVLVSGSRLAAAAAAGFALSTLGGYLLSVQFGLFGFKEIRTTAGTIAGVIEVAAFAALAVLALAPAAQRQPARPVASRSSMLARLQAGVPGAGRAAAAVSVAALVLLVSAVAGAGDPGPSAAGGLETAKIGGVTVLTSAKGFTLYWFAPDTPSKSNCNGGCAAAGPRKRVHRTRPTGRLARRLNRADVPALLHCGRPEPRQSVASLGALRAQESSTREGCLRRRSSLRWGHQGPPAPCAR